MNFKIGDPDFFMLEMDIVGIAVAIFLAATIFPKAPVQLVVEVLGIGAILGNLRKI